MKKVMFVVPYLYGGGAERVVSIWTSGLAELGMDVHLLLFYRVEDEYTINDKVKIHTLSKNRDEYKNLSALLKIKKMRAIFKAMKPCYIIPFVSYVGTMCFFARIGLKSKIIETIRIDPRYSPKSKISRWFRNILVYFSKYCMVQNQLQAQYFPKFMRKKIVVFSNPISDNILKHEKRFKSEKIKNIVAVGRLEEQKNYYMLIDAFSKVEKNKGNLTLNIYGEGSKYEELKRYIKDIGMENNIFLCGRCNNVGVVLEQSDLFILSSIAEGMPNSLMEAMAVGLPCISTDCPTGPADLIDNNINGYLIPINDSDALINSMLDLIENPYKARVMGVNARDKIINNYSASISSAKLMSFLESC